MVKVGILGSVALSGLWAQEMDLSLPESNALYQNAARMVSEQLPLARQNPTRFWRGVSGGVFEGTFLRHENLGKQLVFRDKNQREIIIPYSKLTLENHAYLNARKLLDTGELLPFFLPNQNKTSRRSVDGLKPQPERVNRTIPSLDLGQKVKFESFTEEIIILTLLWWDQNGWLPLPDGKGKDEYNKAKWLSRKIKLGDESISEIYQGLKKYLDEELKDHAALQFFPKENSRTLTPKSEFSLETVKKYATGTNVCLLKLDRYERNKNQGYNYFFVSSVNGDVVTVHYRGENYNLQKKEVLGENQEVVTEFHFTDLKQVPDWLQKSHFVVDDGWLLCITCHVFSEPGKPVAIPADMPQADSSQTIEERPTLPPYAKKMNLVYDKREMEGHLVAASSKVFWFWKNGGSPRLYDSSKLDLRSANTVHNWRYEMGQHVNVDLDWSFAIATGSGSEQMQTKLTRSRQLLWLNQSGSKSSSSCIIDLNTGAFASVEQGSSEVPRYMGRLDLAKWRKQGIAHIAQTNHDQWLSAQVKPSPPSNPVRKREMIRSISANELWLALEILFFPPSVEGKSPWAGIPALYQPLAVDMISSANAAFLLKEYDWINQGNVVPRQLVIEYEGQLTEKMPTPDLKEAVKMMPGTWKIVQ